MRPLNDYIYWAGDGLPAQHSGAIHVLSARLRQGLHFKAFNWDNSVTLQTSSNEQVLPLPKFAIYSNLYATFTIARVLHVQMGVDGNYYTKYYAPAYNPGDDDLPQPAGDGVRQLRHHEPVCQLQDETGALLRRLDPL